jgi:cAMP phosphodiesterase
MMADLVVGHRQTAVRIHCNTACMNTLRRHLFNDALWPDFTRIPTKKRPVFQLMDFEVGKSFKVAGYQVKSIPMNHPVETCGFILTKTGSSMAISGDTGPSELFWRAVNRRDDLKLVLVECSFPNELQQIADISGHLTPRTLEVELDKFKRKDCEVLLYHLKPDHVAQLKREVRHLPVHVLELGEVYEF